MDVGGRTPRVTASRILVLDEHLSALQVGLQCRGIDARTLDEFHATSTVDPDVIRVVDDALSVPWVLLTMDGTIIDEHPGFDWERYAIAWVKVDKHLRGIAVEHAKVDTVQRHAHKILEQRVGDHHSYTRDKHYRHPPSLISARA